MSEQSPTTYTLSHSTSL